MPRNFNASEKNVNKCGEFLSLMSHRILCHQNILKVFNMLVSLRRLKTFWKYLTRLSAFVDKKFHWDRNKFVAPQLNTGFSSIGPGFAPQRPNARKVSIWISLRWLNSLINFVDKPEYSFQLPHQTSSTVFFLLETIPTISQLNRLLTS